MLAHQCCRIAAVFGCCCCEGVVGGGCDFASLVAVAGEAVGAAAAAAACGLSSLLAVGYMRMMEKGVHGDSTDSASLTWVGLT